MGAKKDRAAKPPTPDPKELVTTETETAVKVRGEGSFEVEIGTRAKFVIVGVTALIAILQLVS